MIVLHYHIKIPSLIGRNEVKDSNKSYPNIVYPLWKHSVKNPRRQSYWLCPHCSKKKKKRHLRTLVSFAIMTKIIQLSLRNHVPVNNSVKFTIASICFSGDLKDVTYEFCLSAVSQLWLKSRGQNQEVWLFPAPEDKCCYKYFPNIN